MSYDPPIDSRTTDELIQIAHYTDIWQADASFIAKKELERRGIPLKQQLEKVKAWDIETEKEYEHEMSRRNDQGYTYIELFMIGLKWPFAMLSDWNLKKDGFNKMHKQRLLAIGTGIMLYISFIYYAQYSYDQGQTEWINEVNNTDISDWEREHLSEEEYIDSKSKAIQRVIIEVKKTPTINVYLNDELIDNSQIDQLSNLDFLKVLNVALIRDIKSKEIVTIRIKTET